MLALDFRSLAVSGWSLRKDSAGCRCSIDSFFYGGVMMKKGTITQVYRGIVFEMNQVPGGLNLYGNGIFIGTFPSLEHAEEALQKFGNKYGG